MSQPYPLTVTDAQTGQPLYLNPYRGTYTASRSYALRMQRGYNRGLSQQQARRDVSGTAQPEHIVRAERFQQVYGITEREWLRMRRQYPDIDKINAQVSPGARIRPDMVLEAERMISAGQLPADWIEVRLNNRLYAMRNYREGNPTPGEYYFNEQIYYVPVEWWYYH